MLLSPLRYHHRRLLLTSPRYRILQDKFKSPIIALQQHPMQFSSQSSPPIDATLFEHQSFSLLVRLKTAFQKLREIDRNISVFELTTDSFDVYTTIGRFLFERNVEMVTFYYTSPVSGVWKYYFEEKQQRWISNKDGHIFQENLVRETSKYFKGYLEL